MQLRCPKCKRTLEPDTKICPHCRVPTIVAKSGDSPYRDVLKPGSRISIKGLGSKMSGASKVAPIHHRFSTSDKSTSSQKVRCMKCNTVNEKSDRFCRNCQTRIV